MKKLHEISFSLNQPSHMQVEMKVELEGEQRREEKEEGGG